MINRYDLATISDAERARLLRRSESRIDDLVERIRPIVGAVRDRGDAALVQYTAEFDRVQLDAGNLRVRPGEIAEAHRRLDPRVHAAITHAVRNVRSFHERQMPQELWFTQVEPGVLAGEKVTPITSAGLYVPRGKGSFPSVMYMLAAPAAIAGVRRILVCTPPGPDGTVDPASLVAADLCGVDEIYRVGGAQAIAAMAYGTESIARVHKITGPGSGYVAAAKRLLFGVVDVGVPAGPSESITLADGDADPELVARDVLIEAEHGPDSSALLVTDSRPLIDAVVPLMIEKIASLPEPRRAFCTAGLMSLDGTGGVVLAPDMAAAVEFVNLYAPEHLEVLVGDPFALLPRLENAGEILLGPWTPFCTGNFSVGTNAILPTGGFAHTFSATSVHDFLKRTGIAHVSAAGYEAIRETTRVLAEFEGFPSHARAVTDRFAARAGT